MFVCVAHVIITIIIITIISITIIFTVIIIIIITIIITITVGGVRVSVYPSSDCLWTPTIRVASEVRARVNSSISRMVLCVLLPVYGTARNVPN